MNMISWSIDEVVLLQKDGGNDRLKIIYQAFKEVYLEPPTIPYTDEDGWNYLMTPGRHKALTKWKKDYPDMELDDTKSTKDWLVHVLPAFDMHHWYGNGGEGTAMSSYIKAIEESGVFSEVEEGKKPHIHFQSQTSWTVVQEFWDALCAKYDLEYFQMGIKEDFEFAFNTDTSYQYLPTRYVVVFHDEDGDMIGEKLTADVGELLDFLIHEDYFDSIDDLIPFMIKGTSSNLHRSEGFKRLIRKELTVEQLINAVNEKLMNDGADDDETHLEYIKLTKE